MFVKFVFSLQYILMFNRKHQCCVFMHKLAKYCGKIIINTSGWYTVYGMVFNAPSYIMCVYNYFSFIISVPIAQVDYFQVFVNHFDDLLVVVTFESSPGFEKS